MFLIRVLVLGMKMCLSLRTGILNIGIFMQTRYLETPNNFPPFLGKLFSRGAYVYPSTHPQTDRQTDR